MASPPNAPENAGGKGRAFFPATHWTEIATIRDPAHPEAGEALENLCRTYLPAIENYLRWTRNVPGDPHELANEFLGQFIHQNSLQRVDRAKGRFRNYLYGSIRNFLNGKWRAQATRPEHVEFNEEFGGESSDQEAVARFDKKFVEILVGNAISRLNQRFQGSRIAPLIPFLLPYLSTDPPEETLRQLAVRMGVTEDLIYQNYKRIREELFRQLRQETSRHLGPDDDVELEMQALLRVFARP